MQRCHLLLHLQCDDDSGDDCDDIDDFDTRTLLADREQITEQAPFLKNVPFFIYFDTYYTISNKKCVHNPIKSY